MTTTGTVLGALLPILGVVVIAAFIPYYWLPIRGEIALQPLSETLQQHGYSPDEARVAALTLLPDILHYDRTMPAHYPNGRVMTDDVFSARMMFMVQGKPLRKASDRMRT